MRRRVDTLCLLVFLQESAICAGNIGAVNSPIVATPTALWAQNGRQDATPQEVEAWLAEQSETPYFDALARYSREGVIPFHVPGHKHGRGAHQRFKDLIGEDTLKLEVTQVLGLDDLHHATTVLKDAQELAARAYGAHQTYFLINGSSSGVQAMIMAVCNPGDKILVPRNAHKSTWAALITVGAIPAYVYPEYDYEFNIDHTPTRASYEKALNEHPDAKALLIVSPTYYGVLGDIEGIIGLARERGLVSLVDEAWGPHLRFWRGFPCSSMFYGADVAVNSTHKLIGGMSQASMLHVRDTPHVNQDRVYSVARLFLSTSPSCLMLASLDVARMQMATEGDALLERTVKLAEDARAAINDIPGLGAFGARELLGRPGVYGFDPTRLTIQVKGLGHTGYEAERLLRKNYHVQAEMSDLFNVLCLITIGDRKQDLDALVEGLRDMAKDGRPFEEGQHPFHRCFGPNFEMPDWPPIRMTPREAFFAPTKRVRVADSLGCVAAELVTPYPPGIPIICPGEEITQVIIDYMSIEIEEDFKVHGLIETDDGGRYIRVVA
jgi:arginine decarboxylase